jgi:integrase
MFRIPRSVPAYRRHRASGQAVVTLNGVDHYLGTHGTAASKAEYDRITGEWLANGRQLKTARDDVSDLRIKELVVRYWKFADAHYQRDGEPTRECDKIREVLDALIRLYGSTRVSDFGPVAFKAIRAKMVDSGLCISTIKDRLGKIRRMIKWGVEHELVPADLHHRLSAVAPIRAGRDGVKPSKPVRPVSDEHVKIVLPLVSPQVRAMIELQTLTGMRPGEACRMTTGQLDRGGDIWVYRPTRHKTSDIGKERAIYLGPRCQALLMPWLKADPDAPLFSPIDAVEQRNVKRRTERKTPMTPSQRARRPKSKPKRSPRLWYDKNAYGTAIRRACQVAGIPIWGPNRLRHSLATKVRRLYGLEHAQVVLGHSRADITQVYAESNGELASEVMKAIG